MGEKNKKEMNEKQKCLDVLSRNYTAVFYADFNADMVKPFKMESSANASKLSVLQLHKNVSYTDTMKVYCEKYVEASCKEEFVKFMSREYLMEKLRCSERCIYRYESIPNKGGYHYFEAEAVRVNEAFFDGNVILAFRKIDDIIMNEELQQKKLFELSLTDSLTGLENRLSFNQALTKMADCENLIYITMDVNNLKLCNDRYGQHEGDRILIDIAEGLKKIFENQGYVYRIGGDEFGILMENGNQTTIQDLLEQFRTFLTEKNLRHLMEISLAWGYAIREGRKESLETLINKGNEMMYDHKLRLKKNFAVYREERVKNYLTVLKILSKSTDDYLFIWDMWKDEFWYFEEIDRDYAVHDGGKLAVTTMELEKIVYPSDWKRLCDDLMECYEGKKKFHNLNYRWINRQGEPVWVNCRGTVIQDDKGNPFVMVGRVSDQLLRHLYNPLTKLFNKEKMFSDLKTKVGDSGYFMLMSIDKLHENNVKYGRMYGNKIIKNCAEVLEEMESTQRVWHVDSHYFAVYMDGVSEEEVLAEYEKIAEKLLSVCTLSAGVVPNDQSLFGDDQSLYEAAEITLEKVKTKGEGQIVFFSKEDYEKRREDLLLLAEMRQSIENNCENFYLCYQPQVQAGDYKVFGAEALLRYHSHIRGEVRPDEFIPLLEQYGLIHKVGMWVLKTALEQTCEWRRFIPDFHISVNFSIVQLEERKIGEKVLSLLRETGMPGSALTIELTESVQLQEMSRYTDIFERWYEAGIELSIDDFGTGYSSMSYLKKLKVNEIKIDRIFIKDLQEATYNYRLLGNMIDFARNNDIRICCEGVENLQELSILESLSPNLIQGYLFARPCKTEIFEDTFLNKEMDTYKSYVEFIEKIYRNKEKQSL